MWNITYVYVYAPFCIFMDEISAVLYIVHDFGTKFAGNFFEFHNWHGIFYEFKGNFLKKKPWWRLNFQGILIIFHVFPGNFREKHQWWLFFWRELFQQNVKNILPWISGA